MGRRTFNHEFKLEAVVLARGRGVAVVQTCGDLDISESVLRRLIRESEVDLPELLGELCGERLDPSA